jgi:hypothetical protein
MSKRERQEDLTTVFPPIKRLKCCSLSLDSLLDDIWIYQIFDFLSTRDYVIVMQTCHKLSNYIRRSDTYKLYKILLSNSISFSEWETPSYLYLQSKDAVTIRQKYLRVPPYVCITAKQVRQLNWSENLTREMLKLCRFNVRDFKQFEWLKGTMDELEKIATAQVVDAQVLRLVEQYKDYAFTAAYDSPCLACTMCLWISESRIPTTYPMTRNCLKQIYLMALKYNGNTLSFLSTDMKVDREIVLTAVKEKGSAIQYAAKSLINDREIALAAIHQNAYAIDKLIKLKHDKQIALAAVTKHGLALSNIPEFWNDRDIVLAAVRNDRGGYRCVLQFASDHLKNDRKIVLEAVRYNSEAFAYASERLRRDKEVIQVALKYNHQV